MPVNEKIIKKWRHFDKDIYFLSFGWEVIQCIRARKNKPGINPLHHQNVLQSVREIRELSNEAIIVLLMHWGYELELFPLPMYRQLAFDSIDAEASAIIGCHSHCVQGIEIYRDSPIVYSLGNWLFPHGYFHNGSIAFPEISRMQLAFEWEPEDNSMVCHCSITIMMLPIIE